MKPQKNLQTTSNHHDKTFRCLFFKYLILHIQLKLYPNKTCGVLITQISEGEFSSSRICDSNATSFPSGEFVGAPSSFSRDLLTLIGFSFSVFAPSSTGNAKIFGTSPSPVVEDNMYFPFHIHELSVLSGPGDTALVLVRRGFGCNTKSATKIRQLSSPTLVLCHEIDFPSGEKLGNRSSYSRGLVKSENPPPVERSNSCIECSPFSLAYSKTISFVSAGLYTGSI